jgi:hypothetical protein
MNNKNKKNHVMGRPLIIIDEIEFQVYYEKWMRHSKLNPFNSGLFSASYNLFTLFFKPFSFFCCLLITNYLLI